MNWILVVTIVLAILPVLWLVHAWSASWKAFKEERKQEALEWGEVERKRQAVEREIEARTYRIYDPSRELANAADEFWNMTGDAWPIAEKSSLVIQLHQLTEVNSELKDFLHAWSGHGFNAEYVESKNFVELWFDKERDGFGSFEW